MSDKFFADRSGNAYESDYSAPPEPSRADQEVAQLNNVAPAAEREGSNASLRLFDCARSIVDEDRMARNSKPGSGHASLDEVADKFGGATFKRDKDGNVTEITFQDPVSTKLPAVSVKFDQNGRETLKKGEGPEQSRDDLVSASRKETTGTLDQNIDDPHRPLAPGTKQPMSEQERSTLKTVENAMACGDLKSVEDAFRKDPNNAALWNRVVKEANFDSQNGSWDSPRINYVPDSDGKPSLQIPVRPGEVIVIPSAADERTAVYTMNPIDTMYRAGEHYNNADFKLTHPTLALDPAKEFASQAEHNVDSFTEHVARESQNKQTSYSADEFLSNSRDRKRAGTGEPPLSPTDKTWLRSLEHALVNRDLRSIQNMFQHGNNANNAEFWQRMSRELNKDTPFTLPPFSYNRTADGRPYLRFRESDSSSNIIVQQRGEPQVFHSADPSRLGEQQDSRKVDPYLLFNGDNSFAEDVLRNKTN